MYDRAVIQQELDSILSSHLFKNKRQAGKFLGYIVQEFIEDRGQDITQYSMAVEALGKTPDYNPTENPAVRIEAGRVRKLLTEYYSTAGQRSSVRIRLPVGSYKPIFEEVSGLQEESVPTNMEPKEIQSVGPRVYIHPLYAALKQDEKSRDLQQRLYARMPVVLGRYQEIRLVLGVFQPTVEVDKNLIKQCWQKRQIEFLLTFSVKSLPDTFSINFTLWHTLTNQVVWSYTKLLPSLYAVDNLENLLQQVSYHAFSLHKGTGLLYWSQYWKSRKGIPLHYQVLVEHCYFLQKSVDAETFNLFLRACQKCIQRHPDDSLAHLHYAMLCLYAYMFEFEVETPLAPLWEQLAFKALSLNPLSALAHSAMAIQCFFRGDREAGYHYIEATRQLPSFDRMSRYFLATGLCALGYWDYALKYALLSVDAKSSDGQALGKPQPLHTLPCLFYFYQGHCMQRMTTTSTFQPLGGWELFGELLEQCHEYGCKACIATAIAALDKSLVPPDMG